MPHHSPTPTWKHPLFGANPATLARAFACNGPLPPGVWPLVGCLFLASLLRTPWSMWERARVRSALHRQPQPHAPVFVLGHWRSGTTHLFNLMSRDPRFAWAGPVATGMPWDSLVLGRLLRPLLRRALPAHRFIDAVPVAPDSPQEDEIALASMQNVSYYHGIYFPRRFEDHYRRGVFLEDVTPRELSRWRRRFEYYHRKLLVDRPGTTLLVKNPVYTGRVALIRSIWPDARFIHIHRNPYVVFASTRKFYRALLGRFALQGFRDAVADRLVLEGYPRMVDRLYKDVRDLGPDRFVELGFDDLEREPVEQLERVYASLGIPDFSTVRGRVAEYLGSIQHYRKNEHAFDDETIGQVDRYWGALVERWGYQPPR